VRPHLLGALGVVASRGFRRPGDPLPHVLGHGSSFSPPRRAKPLLAALRREVRG
jgi:hypothetical protein